MDQQNEDCLLRIVEALLNNKVADALEASTELLSISNKTSSAVIRITLFHCSLVLKTFPCLSAVTLATWKGKNSSALAVTHI